VSEVTLILQRLGAGDRRAAEDLLPLVYAELRAIAGAQLAHERPGHTLQPTALVHEAYMRLAGSESGFENRAHFLASGAQAIRRVLVDHARTRKREKRGGGAARVDITSVDPADQRASSEVDLIDLDDALRRLAEVSERAARVVEMRYFGGMTMPEVAVALGVSERTAAGDWAVARAWLRREIDAAGGAP
jgi:RNA polymerase sigma factor (TIGR02999 family)